MGMHICNTFLHSGLVPSHIHAVIPEERLHDLASNSPSLCFLFVLLFDTTPRSLSRRMPGQGSQSACLQHTGIIGIPPPPGSPEAALIAWSPAKGAVTGRKYHYRLFRSLQAVCQNCFKDKFFSLCTFDVILLTDTLTICRWSWRIFLCAFPFG